ncbi:MAG: adenylate/guanylate cyclase domain-containing protein [Nitrospirota bacterium]
MQIKIFHSPMHAAVEFFGLARERGRVAVLVPLLITFIFVVLTIINPAFIDGYLENLLVDYRFKIRNLISPPDVPDNIIIVAIDEKSLSEYGRWPWNRKLQAELLGRIFSGSPKAVAVDVFYPESESRGSDSALAEVISKHKDRIVIALGFEIEEGKRFDGEIEDVLYEHAIPGIENLKYLDEFKFHAYRALLPPEPIAGSAIFGHVYSLPDRDGKLRLENPYIKYGDEYFPSLALQAARIYLDIPQDRIRIIGGAGIDLDGRLIPADETGRLHINYLGREGTISHESAADVLSGRISGEAFRDRIVFVGTSAIATYDIKITPFSANMPGVEKNATVVSNIISGDFIRRAPLFADIIIVLVTGISLSLLSRRLGALHSIFVFISFVLFIFIMNQFLFTYKGIRMNLVYPLLTVISEGTFVISHRYFIEERKARDIRKMFSSYVSPKIVEELINNPGKAGLGGDRKTVTVLFSDIMGFTGISERIAPEKVVELLNEYFTEMTDIIFKWEGTLDKFVGDEIMAFWGAPVDQPDHAERAVRCALDMINRLSELQEKWRNRGSEVLDCGIGINTGEVLVGNIGAAGKKMDYTLIGDHVNTAARVEKLTRQYNAKILITEYTRTCIDNLVEKGAPGHIEMKFIDTVKVRGKEKDMNIYEIRGLRHKEEM